MKIGISAGPKLLTPKLKPRQTLKKQNRRLT